MRRKKDRCWCDGVKFHRKNVGSGILSADTIFFPTKTEAGQTRRSRLLTCHTASLICPSFHHPMVSSSQGNSGNAVYRRWYFGQGAF